MHQNSLRNLNPESRQTINTPPPLPTSMCPHTTTIDLALRISARNFSQPFLPSSRCLASEPCVNRRTGHQSSQRLPRPAGTSIAFILERPAPAPRRSPQTKPPAFRPLLPPVLAGMSVQLAVRMRSGEGCVEEKVVICLQRLACADVAATRARLAGPGSRRKRHTTKGGQRVGGCRLREVRRGVVLWVCRRCRRGQ
jgi:hypothetical protein